MCYTNKQIDNRVKKLKDLERQIAELQAAADAIKDDLKNDLGNVEERKTDNYILRYTTVSQNRLDSAGLKKALPDVYKMYCKVSKYRRFSIA